MKSFLIVAGIVIIVIVMVLVFRPTHKELMPTYKIGQYTQQDFENKFAEVKDSNIFAAKPPTGVKYVYGDVDGNGSVNIGDLIAAIDIVYNKPAKINRRADFNGDCAINYDDLMYFIDWAFLNSNQPPVKPCSNIGE